MLLGEFIFEQQLLPLVTIISLRTSCFSLGLSVTRMKQWGVKARRPRAQ